MSPNRQLVELTQKLIRFNTINPPGQEMPCIEFISKILNSEGFKTHIDPFGDNRANLIATLPGGPSKGHIAFSGHIDTVPIGNDPWKKDPFKGSIEGDKLYGRGSTDMKSGIATMIMAAIAYKKKYPDAQGITLIISGGEETGCEGTAHLIKNPSLLEKTGAMVVAESTSNQPIVAHKGALWLEITLFGKSAHGSTPDQGISAIYKAAEFIKALEKFNFNQSPHPVLGHPTLNIGTIKGGININSVPDQVTLGIDIRTIPGMKNDLILETLKKTAGEKVALHVKVNQPGVASDPSHPWIQTVCDILGKHMGKRPSPIGVNYFTDASVLTPGLGHPPTVIVGPGEVDMPHKKDEYVLISKMETATKIYYDLIEDWLKP